MTTFAHFLPTRPQPARGGIEATGTRNTASAGPWIWVDAFDVLDGATGPP